MIRVNKFDFHYRKPGQNAVEIYSFRVFLSFLFHKINTCLILIKKVLTTSYRDVKF